MGSIETTAFFKLGPRPLNELSLARVLDEEVKSVYQALSDVVKQQVSLLDFSLQSLTTRASLQQYFSSGSVGLSLELQGLIRRDAAGRCSDLREIALNWLKNVPPDAPSDDVDRYISACVQQNNDSLSARSERLDQWNYAARCEKSRESLLTSSLFSQTTVQPALDGKNVHFMMFDEGSTKIKCYRFDFGGSQLDTDASALDDPAAVDRNFRRFLDLREDVQTKLPIQASRLEIVQNVLSRIENVSEAHTQDLFHHVLSMLLRDLEKDNPDMVPIVDNVVGMKEMAVVVEVCASYLLAQAEAKGQPTGYIASTKRILTIKSDLAVSMLPVASLRPQKTDFSVEALELSSEDEKFLRFLYCNYHIELKIARGELKDGARQPKAGIVSRPVHRVENS